VLLYRPEAEDLIMEARATTREHARTFAAACRLLPRSVRDDVYRLYLVFRVLDDLVDEGDARAEAAVAAVERWCRDGRVSTRETSVLADLASRHPLPRQPLLDFCLGMRQDLDPQPLRDESELELYCYRVAGTVGLVMASVLGTRSPDAAHHAAALGMAMQWTNILRDIDEDLAAGRLYLAGPMKRHGWPQPGRREALLREQVARADELYEVGMAGIPMLRRGRPAIRAAASMYREILRQIERDGYGARPGRAVVSSRRKLLAAARASVRQAAFPALFTALVAAQLAYPRVPAERQPRATAAVVSLMLACSAAETAQARGSGRAVALLASAGVVGFAAELVGTATGRPFGRYRYGGRLGRRVGGVPLAAAAAWAMMARPAWAVGGLVGSGRGARVAASAAALCAWDVFLDPRMVRDGYWEWRDGGRYEGVPASNFAGWLATGGVLFSAWTLLDGEPEEPGQSDGALALYLWTWAGETLANAVVWRRPRVALAGAAAMGAVAIPALASRRRARRR
jgi:15-cis-phytoene synthase